MKTYKVTYSSAMASYLLTSEIQAKSIMEARTEAERIGRECYCEVWEVVSLKEKMA